MPSKRKAPESRELVRAALYCRVSTDEQAEEGQSIGAQTRLLREYCLQHQWEVVDQFVDEGFSATTDKRPAFQRMIAMAKLKPRPFDLILAHKNDRFARNREHAIVYKNLLRRECGVDVVFLSEPFDDTPQGRLMEGMMEVMAEFYSANLGQEVKKGMTEKALRGEVLGSAPVGYVAGDNGKLIPTPGASDAVRWMYETYANGTMGYTNIARVLRAEGHIRFPGLPTFKWSAQAVRNILTNEAYLGTRIWNMRDSNNKGRKRPEDDWIVATDAHEPIVTRDLFERVQARRRSRVGPKGSLGDYLLRGIVRCEECGSVMYRRLMKTSKTRRGSYGQFMILSCSRYYRGDGACYFNWVRMDELTDALNAELRKIVNGSDLEGYEIIYSQKDSGELSSVQRALDRCQARYQRQLAAYESGVIDLAELRESKERIASERAGLERRLEELRTMSARGQIPEAAIRRKVAQAISALAEGNDEEVESRRLVLESVLGRVTYSRKHLRLRIQFRV